MMLVQAQQQTQTLSKKNLTQRAQRTRHKCPLHEQGNYDKLSLGREKKGDLHSEMDWRWMKQEKGLFRSLFSIDAMDSPHHVLF